MDKWVILWQDILDQIKNTTTNQQSIEYTNKKLRKLSIIDPCQGFEGKSIERSNDESKFFNKNGAFGGIWTRDHYLTKAGQ